MKVYCNNCKYFYRRVDCNMRSYFYCKKHITAKEDLMFYNDFSYQFNFNDNNNCSDYKRKWWKFWI